MTDFRRNGSMIALVALSFIAAWSWAHLTEAVGAPSLVAGSDDGRGYVNKIVDGETEEAVRFNACEPVHYVINPDLAPPNGVEDIHTAIQMTAEASGLRFVYDGATDEVAVPHRPAYQPERYGDRWAPILFSWSNSLPTTAVTADAEGRRPIAAAASSHEINDDGRAAYVTGIATFDADVVGLREGFGGQTWGQAMLHELGHVLGLDHIDDPASVMNPVMGLRAAMWGGGDRAGLWALGIGSPCLRTPDTP